MLGVWSSIMEAVTIQEIRSIKEAGRSSCIPYIP